jgi:hypothetical protein
MIAAGASCRASPSSMAMKPWSSAHVARVVMGSGKTEPKQMLVFGKI